MENLTQMLGFDARYLLYPILALLIAAIIRFVILRYLRKIAERTQSTVDDQAVSYLETLVTPLLLISILYYLSRLLPLSQLIIEYIQQGLIVASILMVAFHSARLVSSILTIFSNSLRSGPNLIYS